MPTQRSPVRLMVEAMRPGLPGLNLDSVASPSTYAGWDRRRAMPLLQSLNQSGVVLLSSSSSSSSQKTNLLSSYPVPSRGVVVLFAYLGQVGFGL
jgi:hypothetical protein